MPLSDSLNLRLEEVKNKKDKKAIYLFASKQLAADPSYEMKKLTKDGFLYIMELKDTVAAVLLLQNWAAAYRNLGKMDSVNILLFDAVQLIEKTNYETVAASLYNEIGRLHRRTDSARAVVFYDKAMKIYQKNNDFRGEATILNESGVVYSNFKNYPEAIKRFEASLEISKKLNDLVSIGYSLEFLSSAFMDLKEYKKAEDYLSKALEIRKSLNDPLALAINYTNFGEFYLTSGKIDVGIEQVLMSNEIAQKIPYLDLVSYNYDLLSKLYTEKKDYKNAFENMKAHNEIKDSLFNLTKAQQIEELNIKYETEINKNLIKEQKFHLTIQRYLNIAIIVGIMIGTVIIISYFKRIKTKNQLKMQQALMQEQEKNMKLIINAEEEERIRIAKDLHDGIGQMMSAAKMNLSALDAELSFKNEEQAKTYKNAIELVDESCQELRTVSHNMMPNSILNNNLDLALKNFLQKIDVGRLQVNLYTEGLENRLEPDIENMIYRIVQESVQNTLKHAQARNLDIAILNIEDSVDITIEDDGVGFEWKKDQEVKGIGLKNIISRVKYLKGEIDIDSAPDRGTLIAITVPLKINSI